MFSLLMLGFYAWYFALAVGISVGALFSFIDSSKNTFPVLNFVFFVACLQWLLGPFLDYTFFNSHYRYHMYVEAEEYFSLVIPSVLALGLGLSWLKSSINLQNLKQYIQDKVKQEPNLPIALISIGFLAEYVGFMVPPALRFILFMVTTFKYIGLLYLIFSHSEKKWTTLLLVTGFTVVNAIFLGMFHDFLLWAAFIFIYISYYFQLTLKTKLLAVITGAFLAFTIQIVKSEYRKIIWASDFSGSQTEVFSNVLSEQLNEADSEGESNFHNAVIRLNQGWIISRIMYHVPFYEEHADGETIKEAIYASMLPRFLNPAKKKAGGQENFERFTGYELMSGTSMGTSVVGEAYANYGQNGTILFMFLYGLLLSLVAQKVFKLSATKYPTLILWLPLIFLQVVKAETELVVVLNHLVKASIFVFGVYWISRKILKVEL
jgi:hypothetical protein